MLSRLYRWAVRLGMLILVWPLLLPGNAAAQSRMPRAENYSIDDGLSDRLVNDLIQDQLGFIWIATPNGLNRFDGYEFLVFNNHPDNPYPISGTNIQQLDLDEHGNIVIQYSNNKLFFDILNPRTNEVSKVRLFPEDGIQGYVRNIYVNPAGKIHLVSVKKQDREGTYLFRYQPGAKPAFHLLFRIPEVHSSLSPTIDVVQLPDGSFLINDSELGLRLFSASGALLHAFDAGDFDCLENDKRYPGPANFLHLDRQGVAWISLAQIPGVFRYVAEQEYFEQLSGLDTQQIYTHLWEDQAGNLLLARGDKVYPYPEVSELQSVRPNGAVADFSYLAQINPQIRCAYGPDFFKTVYLGTNSGLSIVQNSRAKISTYLAQFPSSRWRNTSLGGITGNGRGAVYFVDEVNHWYALDLAKDRLDTMNIVDEATGEMLPMSSGLGLLYDESSGYLWGISNSRNNLGLLHRVDPVRKTARTYTFSKRFSSFARSDDGRFWLVCHSPEGVKGLIVSFDTQTRRFSEYRPNGRNPLQGLTPYFILAGKNNLLWIGTDNGLISIDPAKGKTQPFTMGGAQQSPGLSNNHVYVIHQDKMNRLWLGTNNGINVFDPATGRISVLDKRNGLASNTVFGILPDEKGNMWFSTNNGLSYYEPDKGRFRNFYAEDGFSSDEFALYSYYRDEMGRYYFGGANGLNAFFSSDLLVNDPPPPVVLTRLSRYNSRKDSLISECTPLCEIDEVVISPYDIYFQFQFMLPSFSRTRKNQFSAWLEGYENGWIYLGNSPNIRYSKLPPGHYTLHLNGADPNGNWSKTPVSINIRVRPIFYRTTWFLILAGVIVISFIYGWIKYRVEQKLKVERLRTKLSSDLHDEVSGLLSGIAMQTEVLQELVEEESSRNRLRSISEKSRKAMSKMSDVIWSMDSRNDRVQDLLLRMHEHAEEILSPLNVQYYFHVKRIDRQLKMPVKIRQELYFIFKEAINNIAKHANASRVDILLGNNGAQFEMTIHDNGNGVHKEKVKVNGHRKTGQGLSNIRMRAQRIDAQLDIFDRQGYTVQLRMKKFV